MKVLVFSFCQIVSQIPRFLNLYVNMCEMGFKSTVLAVEFK